MHLPLHVFLPAARQRAQTSPRCSAEVTGSGIRFALTSGLTGQEVTKTPINKLPVSPFHKVNFPAMVWTKENKLYAHLHKYRVTRTICIISAFINTNWMSCPLPINFLFFCWNISFISCVQFKLGWFCLFLFCFSFFFNGLKFNSR